MGMKIDETIKIHKEWKTKVGDYILSPDRSLKPESCHERCCELTNWLTSDEASALLNRNEMHEIQKAHKAFHHTICELIINANRGVDISEEMALGVDSIFHRHSESLLRILSKIKDKTKSEAA